jgi:hypothetical protein
MSRSNVFQYNEEDDDELPDMSGSRKLNSLDLSEAQHEISERMREQIRKANQMNATPNESVQGDSYVGAMFKSLLPLQMQRAVFKTTLKRLEDATRARSLFGAPPYPFLNSSDNQMLNASGIARGRTNMSCGDRSIPMSNHFGTAHAVDTHGRSYRAFQNSIVNGHGVAIACASWVSSDDNADRNKLIVKIVRSRKRQRDIEQFQRMPMVGEVISVNTTPFVKNALGIQLDATFKVRAFRTHVAHARTAMLIVDWLSVQGRQDDKSV